VAQFDNHDMSSNKTFLIVFSDQFAVVMVSTIDEILIHKHVCNWESVHGFMKRSEFNDRFTSFIIELWFGFSSRLHAR